jgi:hypothetical protein
MRQKADISPFSSGESGPEYHTVISDTLHSFFLSMPVTYNHYNMVSELESRQYDDMSAHWPRATYTSSSPVRLPPVPTLSTASNADSMDLDAAEIRAALSIRQLHGSTRDSRVRDSMARLSTAAQQNQRQQMMATMDELHDQGEEEYMRAREYYQDTYWRARQEAHTALSEMNQQSRQDEILSLQRTSQSAENTATSSSRPPSKHRVYLINCKSCGSFLTDRGMKAILLLRPHITLYSTDAIPNCGPLHDQSDSANANEPVLERTCNCLTQTLGCYGCGNAVGYHIVSPCSRCTSSVAKHQRNSNGHRTVLHCAEISVRERRYVPGEAGVKTAQVDYSHIYRDRKTVSPPNRLRSAHYYNRQNNSAAHRRNSMTGVDDLLSEEQGMEEESKEYSHHQDTYYDDALGISTSRPSAAAVSLPDPKGPREMKRGDTVYWSDLVTGGERCPPVDSDELLDMPVAGR